MKIEREGEKKKKTSSETTPIASSSPRDEAALVLRRQFSVSSAEYVQSYPSYEMTEL